MEKEALANKMNHPNLSLLRAGLFWDTDIITIDWHAKRRAVIERILERGNEREQSELKRFYGDAVFDKIVAEIKIQHA